MFLLISQCSQCSLLIDSKVSVHQSTSKLDCLSACFPIASPAQSDTTEKVTPEALCSDPRNRREARPQQIQNPTRVPRFESKMQASRDNQPDPPGTTTRQASDTTEAPVTEFLISWICDEIAVSPLHPKSQRILGVGPVESIERYDTVDTFVFRDPWAFHVFFSGTALGGATPRQGKIRDTVTKVRLDLIHSIKDERPAKGTSPIIAKSYSDWRQACKGLPKGHGITEVIFDLSKSQNEDGIYGEPFILSPLVQNLSTVIALKSRGPFCSRLEGLETDENRRAYVENSLVSVVVSESGERRVKATRM